MPKKKNKVTIVDIVVNTGAIYAVGSVPEHFPQGSAVEKIIFNRPDSPYNKGFQVSGPSYTVFFEDSPSRRVIPAKAVSDVGVVIEAPDDAVVPDILGVDEQHHEEEPANG